MKKILSILLMAAATQGLLRADTDTNLFGQVKAKYATCASFYCEGTSTMVSDMQGKEAPFKQEKKFTIRFSRPALLRVDWIEPSMSSFSPVTNSIFTADGKYYTLASFQHAPRLETSMEMAMGTMAGVSGENSYLIPSLLVGKAGYFDNVTAMALPDAKLNGHDCKVLELANKKTGSFTLYIDKSTSGIIRIHQVQTVDVKEMRATIAKAMKNSTMPTPALPKNDFTIENTFDYSSISFNQVMKPEEFVFPGRH